jgi:hypothetical protein
MRIALSDERRSLLRAAVQRFVAGEFTSLPMRGTPAARMAWFLTVPCLLSGAAAIRKTRLVASSPPETG